MLLTVACFPLKLLPEDVSDLCHVLFFTLFCAMFHAILVIAISLQTYGQEYFMNEEVSGMYNITSSHLYENCNLKLSKYFARVIAESIQKLAGKSATANNLCYLLHPSDSISLVLNHLFPLCTVLLDPSEVKRVLSGRIPKAALHVCSAGGLAQLPLSAFCHKIVSPHVNKHLNRL